MGHITGIHWQRELIRYKRGAIQIMVGRPRKIGKRQPNGQLARTYVNPKAQVASQPHRVLVMAKYREYPEAESEFGRMMLRGVITPAQLAAGIAYAEAAAGYRAVYDIPSPNPSGIDLTRVGVSQGVGMSSEIAAKLKRRYCLAFEACGEAGNKAPRVVKNHAVLDKPVGDFETLRLLKNGLDKLVKHFGIDPALQISKGRS